MDNPREKISWDLQDPKKRARMNARVAQEMFGTNVNNPAIMAGTLVLDGQALVLDDVEQVKDDHLKKIANYLGIEEIGPVVESNDAREALIARILYVSASTAQKHVVEEKKTREMGIPAVPPGEWRPPGVGEIGDEPEEANEDPAAKKTGTIKFRKIEDVQDPTLVLPCNEEDNEVDGDGRDVTDDKLVTSEMLAELVRRGASKQIAEQPLGEYLGVSAFEDLPPENDDKEDPIPAAADMLAALDGDVPSSDDMALDDTGEFLVEVVGDEDPYNTPTPEESAVSSSAFVMAGVTHPGVRRASEPNQDHFALHEGHGVVILSDGAGGHAGGAWASQVAVTAIMEHLLRTTKGRYDQDFIDLGMGFAHTAVMHPPADMDVSQGKPTGTLLVLSVLPDGLHMGSMGDSFILLVRNEEWAILTPEENVYNKMFQDLRDMESHLPDEAIHGMVLYRMSRLPGYRPEYLANSLGASHPQTNTRAIGYKKGDLVVLCSDGLTKHVGFDAIASVGCVFRGNPRGAAEQLVNLAIEDGGSDNVTVVVVELLEDSTGSIPADPKPPKNPYRGFGEERVLNDFQRAKLDILKPEPPATPAPRVNNGARPVAAYVGMEATPPMGTSAVTTSGEDDEENERLSSQLVTFIIAACVAVPVLAVAVLFVVMALNPVPNAACNRYEIPVFGIETGTLPLDKKQECSENKIARSSKGSE